MNTFRSISRRFLVLLLTFTLLLGCVVPALAEGEASEQTEVSAPAQEPAPKPAAEPAPKPAEEPAPKPAEEPAPKPAEEPAPKPAEEPAPKPAEEPAPKPAEEPAPKPAEEPAPQPAGEPAAEEPTEETTVPAEEPTEELKAETEKETVAKEPVEKLYFWVDPITHVVYSDLTYEQCLAVIRSWIAHNPDKILINAAPTPMGSPAPAPGFTLVAKENEAEETVAVEAEETEPAAEEETTQDAAAAEEAETAEKAGYSVEFKIGEKEAKFDGNDAVTLEQLLKALDIEVPEGAEVALDVDSVDPEHLAWEEKDGEMVLTFKGTFNIAKNLVVYIDGVPTEIGVVDGKSAETAKSELGSTVKNLTKGGASYVIDSSVTHKNVVIDLKGKTLTGGDIGDDYALVIGDETDPIDKMEVTLKNGIIEAAGNAIKVVGNTILNLVNMTINAAKTALNIGSTAANTVVNIDEDTVLHSGGKGGAATVMIADAAGSKPNTLVIEGTVENCGTGYAIGTDKVTEGNLEVTLMPTANIVTNKNPRVFDSRLITDGKESTIFSMGASVSSSKDIEKFGMTVFDLNYDTEDMLHTISWGSYSSSSLSDWFTPSRPGMAFKGWNTKPDGSGTYYTMKEILEKKIEHVYAIWGPVDYHWLIAATAMYNGNEVYAATRMEVKNGVAVVTFEDAGKHKLDIVKVAVKDLKNLRNRGINTLHICFSNDLAVEFDMDTLQECVGIDAKGNRYNTADIYNEESILTAVAGKTVLYNLETSALQADTKNAITAAYAANGLTIRYGNDEVFRVNAANLGAATVQVLKDSKLVSLSVDGLDVTKYEKTRNVLDKAVASGTAVAEAAKLK